MKANELRIGNYVQFSGGAIYKVDMLYIGFGGLEFWKPIPLTEEWLLKFGFEKKGCNWELPNFRFHVNKSVNYDGFLFCDGYSVITEKIQHVHQLQNLYFALTQKELTL